MLFGVVVVLLICCDVCAFVTAAAVDLLLLVFVAVVMSLLAVYTLMHVCCLKLGPLSLHTATRPIQPPAHSETFAPMRIWCLKPEPLVCVLLLFVNVFICVLGVCFGVCVYIYVCIVVYRCYVCVFAFCCPLMF